MKKSVMSVDGRTLGRRDLLRSAAVALGAVWLYPAGIGAGLASLTACSEAVEPTKRVTLDLGTEAGVLNYCYAIAQLEQDFFARMSAIKWPGVTSDQALAIVRAQSAATTQTNKFIAIIPAGRITDAILFTLGAQVNFSNRSSALAAAQLIEESAASAYAGAVAKITTPDNVTTVQTYATNALARANTFRGMLGLAPLTAAASTTPGAILQTLAPYYLTTLTLRNA